MVSSSLSFIVADGRFGLSKLGNYMKLTKHAAMQPPTKDGPERSQWRCARTPLVGTESAQLCWVVFYDILD